MDGTVISAIKAKELTRRVVCALCIFLFISGAFTSLHGQSLSISARFDTTTIRIGEQTAFTITIEQPTGIYVRLPEFTDTLSAGIEILQAGLPDTIMMDDRNMRVIRSWRVTSFEPGDHNPGAIPFAFLLDAEERVMHARPPALRVLEPDIDQEAGIYDIKAPFAISLGARDVLPWILLAAVLAVLMWYGYRYLVKKKPVQPAFQPPERLEAAHVTAMKELRKLKSESLWQSGMVKEYYIRLTGIIRKYIERRFGITAMERTSREIISELKSNESLPAEVIGMLEQCLLTADLVKFAKARPGEEYHELSLNTGFRFVKETCGPDPESGDSPSGNMPCGENGHTNPAGIDEAQGVK